MSKRKNMGRSSGSTKKATKSGHEGIGSRRTSAVSKRHPLFGFLKGTVTIAPGVDLTEPADPYWGLDLGAFTESLSVATPPRGIAPALLALWWAKKGDSEQAHRLVMGEASSEAAWVHAYLHRVEGDLANADYWYAKGHQRAATGDLDTEWDAIVIALLKRYQF